MYIVEVSVVLDIYRITSHIMFRILQLMISYSLEFSIPPSNRIMYGRCSVLKYFKAVLTTLSAILCTFLCTSN